MTQPINLDELEQKARAATPEVEWRRYGKIIQPANRHFFQLEITGMVAEFNPILEYVVAAQPQNILSLIEVIRRQREAINHFMNSTTGAKMPTLVWNREHFKQALADTDALLKGHGK